MMTVHVVIESDYVIVMYSSALNMRSVLLVLRTYQFLPRDASAERGYEITCCPSVCNDQVPCT